VRQSNSERCRNINHHLSKIVVLCGLPGEFSLPLEFVKKHVGIAWKSSESIKLSQTM